MASARSRCSSSCSERSSGPPNVGAVFRFTEFELRQIAAVRKDLDDEYQTCNHAEGSVIPAPYFQQIQALTGEKA